MATRLRLVTDPVTGISSWYKNTTGELFVQCAYTPVTQDYDFCSGAAPSEPVVSVECGVVENEFPTIDPVPSSQWVVPPGDGGGSGSSGSSTFSSASSSFGSSSVGSSSVSVSGSGSVSSSIGSISSSAGSSSASGPCSPDVTEYCVTLGSVYTGGAEEQITVFGSLNTPTGDLSVVGSYPIYFEGTGSGTVTKVTYSWDSVLMQWFMEINDVFDEGQSVDRCSLVFDNGDMSVVEGNCNGGSSIASSAISSSGAALDVITTEISFFGYGSYSDTTEVVSLTGSLALEEFTGTTSKGDITLQWNAVIGEWTVSFDVVTPASGGGIHPNHERMIDGSANIANPDGFYVEEGGTPFPNWTAVIPAP